MKKTLLVFFIPFSFLLVNSFSQVPGACSKNNIPQVNNGNATLGMSYNNTACGLNYIQTSQLIETRYNQYTTTGALGVGLPTSLTIFGIPATATIDKAFVWYFVSYLAATSPASSVIITNPASASYTIAATNAGQDISKCWGETGTANYRADVTAAFSGNGTYGIDISGITGTNTNMPNWYDQVDGINLFIIYTDASASYQGSLIIWDGNKTTQGTPAMTQTMFDINACGNSTFANAFNIISDMQDNVNLGKHISTLNAAIDTFPNKMWNFDIASTTVNAGQATAAFGADGGGSDCFTWGVMGLYYQTNCTPCNPTAVSNSVTEPSSFYVFPNPNKGEFEIHFPSEINGNLQIEIINFIGEKIYSEEMKNTNRISSRHIQLQSASPGIYMLRIKDKSSQSVKLISIQ